MEEDEMKFKFLKFVQSYQAAISKKKPNNRLSGKKRTNK